MRRGLTKFGEFALNTNLSGWLRLQHDNLGREIEEYIGWTQVGRAVLSKAREPGCGIEGRRVGGCAGTR
ncbi:MAG: hypothetical protein ACTSRS_14210 [Candidatus Helarchaeota archaeon]